MLLEYKSINARVAIFELRTTITMAFLKPCGACLKKKFQKWAMNSCYIVTAEIIRNPTARANYDLRE
jgi:hypothetical protein